MKIYNLIIEDRHSDTVAIPFSTSEKALAAAERWLAEPFISRLGVERRTLSRAMEDCGWIFNAHYGDSNKVRVVESELDQQQGGA